MIGPRSVKRGFLFLAAALLAGVLAALLIAARLEGGRPRSIVLILACVAAGSGLAVLGVRALRRHPSEPPPDAHDYRHMTPLFAGTVIVMGVLGFVLDALVPANYGLIGPYRAEALTVAAAGAPVHLGEPACVDCHEKQVSLHDKDAHARVPCESCHGPGDKHVAFRRSDAAKSAAVPASTVPASTVPASTVPATAIPASAIPAEARMLVRKERAWCLRCHEADPARPGSFPQIVWTEHMRVSGVLEPAPAAPGGEAAETTPGDGPDTATGTLPCGRCHDPHEPLFMDRDLRTARLHPLVHRCQDCHGRVEADFVAAGPPAKHPVTFECSYCHAAVADEFTRSPHKSLQCTNCHVFFSESSFSGRIIRDADPRFCLLCHKRADYRREDGPKTIRWPSHRDAMKSNDQDTRQNCIECHRPAMHYPAPPPKAEVDVDALFGDDPTPAPDTKQEQEPAPKPDAKKDGSP